MTMHCFRHAIRVAGIVLAMTLMAGCGRRGAAEKSGPDLAMRTAANGNPGEAPSGRMGAVETMGDGPRHLLQPMAIELYHFNVYQRFHALSDASSGSGQGRATADAQAGEQAGDEARRAFACSASGMIKQGD